MTSASLTPVFKHLHFLKKRRKDNSRLSICCEKAEIIFTADDKNLGSWHKNTFPALKMNWKQNLQEEILKYYTVQTPKEFNKNCA